MLYSRHLISLYGKLTKYDTNVGHTQSEGKAKTRFLRTSYTCNVDMSGGFHDP